MTKSIRNVGIYAIGNLLPQAVNYLLLPVFTKYLSPADYGIIASMQTLTTIMLIVLTMSVDKAMPRLYFEYTDTKSQRAYSGTIAVTLFCFSSLIILSLFALHGPISGIYKSIPFYPFYSYALGAAFLETFFIVPRTLYWIRGQAGYFLMLTVSQFAVLTALSLWFVVGKGEGAAGALKGRLIADAVFIPVLVYATFRNSEPKIDFTMLKRSVAFSAPLVPALLAAWIMNWSDRLFLERFVGLDEVGVYSVGYRMGQIALIVSGAISMAYYPIFFKTALQKDEAEAKRKLVGMNDVVVRVSAFVSFGVALLGHEIVAVMLNRRYAAASVVIPVISLAYFMSATSSVVSLGILQEKKTLANMLIAILGAVISFGLNWLLIPHFKSMGAAVATVLAFAVTLTTAYIYSRRCYFVPLRLARLFITLAIYAALAFGCSFLDGFSLWVSLSAKLLVLSAAAFQIYHSSKSFRFLLSNNEQAKERA